MRYPKFDKANSLTREIASDPTLYVEERIHYLEGLALEIDAHIKTLKEQIAPLNDQEEYFELKG